MRHYKRSSGFVLLMVMVFLLIFSALSLYGLTRAASTIKNIHRMQQFQIATMQAEKILDRIEYAEMEPCVIPTIAADEFANKPLSWWERTVCGGKEKNLKYHYVVEALGNVPCATLNDGTARYQRITLFALPALCKGATILLQSTVIKPGVSNLSCEEPHHLVKPGRQMLRVIRGME
jgi:hypothetical protein